MKDKYKLPKDRKKQLKEGRNIVRGLRNMNASEIEIISDLKERGFTQDRIELIFNSLLIDELKLISKGKSPTIFRKIKSDLETTNFFLSKINEYFEKIEKELSGVKK